MRVLQAVVLSGAVCSIGLAQQADPIPSNRFAIVAAYSNDSSHIIMGRAQDRRFSYVGLQYDRVLLRKRLGVLAYQAEWRPVAVNFDPEERYIATIQTPGQATQTYSGAGRGIFCKAGTVVLPPDANTPQTITYVTQCGHTATFGQALSPAGFRFNLMPHERWQPIVSGSAGILLSTRPIPLDQAGSFNFLFDFGMGVERIMGDGRSWRLEYLVQHYSNKETADQNPGVDNGVFKVSYAFGR